MMKKLDVDGVFLVNVQMAVTSLSLCEWNDGEGATNEWTSGAMLSLYLILDRTRTTLHNDPDVMKLKELTDAVLKKLCGEESGMKMKTIPRDLTDPIFEASNALRKRLMDEYGIGIGRGGQDGQMYNITVE